MKRSKKQISLQTKIVVLIVSLILFIVTLLAGLFFYLERKEVEDNTGNRALHFAKTISYMSEVQQAMESENPTSTLQPLTEKIQKEIGAEFIVIGDTNSLRFAHPDPSKIGKHMVGGDNDRALEKGESYISKAEGSLGPSIRGKAPIFNNEGTIIGVISVGFLMESVRDRIEERMIKIASIAIVVTVIGIAGGVLLARNIRKEILGLEPFEIASLYRERNAILQSVKEGIIAIDSEGYITMINPSAMEILQLHEHDILNKRMEEIVPDTDIFEVLHSGQPQENKEVILFHKDVIVNRIPIIEKGVVVGVVSSFRDKTEMKKVLHTLLEVKKYSEELRAQTHEFTNKLYVISGLLELGKHKEALEWIQSEYKVHQEQNKILFEQISDEKLQAILLGKMAIASEKKITLTLDEASSIHSIPSHIELASLVTIIGNLIDNAMDAVEEVPEGNVTFFSVDYGDDLIIEVIDNGLGIAESEVERIFEKGYSTKKGLQPRGYGLALVNEEVQRLGGMIEVNKTQNGATVFSVFLPKEVRTKGVD
jgi:CitB family two-component system sensor histidine kinase CitS